MTIIWLSFFYLGITNPQFSFSISINLTLILYLVYLSISLFMLIKGFKNENNSTIFEVLIVFGILIIVGTIIFILSIFV